MLRDGEAVRGIFHPHERHFHMDPHGVIEQWDTLSDARNAFTSRAAGGLARTYYLGEEPGWEDGYEVDGTAYMDVWIAEKDEEPGVGEMWQRWRLRGCAVVPENF